ncbi:MAG TPA: hypothetical protein VFP24_09615 [Gaiellaceae bacterium]|jgi:MFS family permease|nr:hypothetical protein [Gaiellaceae bacterium]
MSPTQGVIGEAWDLYKRHWQHLFTIAFIVYAITSLLGLILVATLTWFGAILAAIISLVAYFWVQGALITAVADIRDGRVDLSVGETFQRVRPRLGSIIVGGILLALAISIGFLLLIVPGLLALTWWSMVIPVIVLEGRSAGESFGRSRDLVRGYAWGVFGIIILTFLILVAFSIVLSLILSPVADWLQSFVSDVITGTVATPFAIAAWSILYFRLRDAKEAQVAPAAEAPVEPPPVSEPSPPPSEPPPASQPPPPPPPDTAP